MQQTVQITQAQKSLVVIEGTRKEILRGLSIFILVAVVFLFLRLLLKLFGANPETLIVGFIYLVSDIILLPYFGIFPQSNDLLPGRASIDTAAFFAIFCYVLLIGLAMAVVQIASTILKTGKQVNETVEKKQTLDTTIVDESIE